MTTWKAERYWPALTAVVLVTGTLKKAHLMVVVLVGRWLVWELAWIGCVEGAYELGLVQFAPDSGSTTGSRS